MVQIRFGIDLGGTKIEIIGLLVKQNDKQVTSETIYQKRIATPKGDYAATLNAITDLVTNAEAALSKEYQSFLPGLVGVGIPGAISLKTGKVKNANSVWLIGEDLQGDLQAKLNRPVKLANDANCFALSEATDGAGQNINQATNIVFGVIIGTGCGGGVVVNGQILNGINAIGGEWGHNPLPWMTQDDIAMDCYCGLQGCNETFLSGSGFENHYFQRTGLVKTAQQIVALSEQGDKEAEQLMQDYITWLAKGLASVINVIDPDVIVLGGGMSNIDRLYRDIPKIWQKWVFSDVVDTKLLPPKFGDSSGVRGAAWL
ncbi:ROK family protein [Thiomicrorhabdus sp.]|uniref:ROK family protein n=1 Tax=Thiomicrorhabdus sp. TaxID=2039724 RepID=UPI002AA5E6C0|nr:ROK family protein [Thiomicrorhabdus sp.]